MNATAIATFIVLLLLLLLLLLLDEEDGDEEVMWRGRGLCREI